MAEHFRRSDARNYVVDPVGFHAMLPFGLAAAQQFGKLPRHDGGVLASFFGKAVDTLQPAEIEQGLVALNLLAEKFGRLRDGRIVQLDTFADQAGGPAAIKDNGGNVVGVRLDTSVSPEDLAAIQTSDTWFVPSPQPDRPIFAGPENTEVTLFSIDGNFSQTYSLSGIDVPNRSVYWNDFSPQRNARADFNRNGEYESRGLPSEFGEQIGRVVIKSIRAADFSWMLTVRRSANGQARGDIVVRFNSEYRPEDETLFEATFGAGTFFAGVNARTPTSVNPVDPPILKRGNYVLDALNARWYRIAAVEERPAPAFITSGSLEEKFWSTYQYRLRLETPVVEAAGNFYVSPTPNSPEKAATYSAAGAVFLPGIVDVYPISSLTMPDSL
jgi:hypothetical protein